MCPFCVCSVFVSKGEAYFQGVVAVCCFLQQHELLHGCPSSSALPDEGGSLQQGGCCNLQVGMPIVLQLVQGICMLLLVSKTDSLLGFCQESTLLVIEQLMEALNVHTGIYPCACNPF